MDSAVVETTDVGERIMEEEPKVATEEFTSEAPAAPPESMGKHRTHCRHTYLKLNTKQCLFICMMVYRN